MHDTIHEVGLIRTPVRCCKEHHPFGAVKEQNFVLFVELCAQQSLLRERSELAQDV